MITAGRRTKDEYWREKLMMKEPENANVRQPEWSSEKQQSADWNLTQSQAAAMPCVFVAKKHDAIRAGLHYDFRLGHNGVLLSWAVPDGPSYWPGHRRKAVQVGDHSREYAFSERVIYDGPGTGTVMVWDWGTWAPLPGYADVDACLRNGLLKFTLFGERLKGNWTLARAGLYAYNRRKMIWTLTKEQDSFARSETATSISEEATTSILTGRTMKEIADENSIKDKYRNEQQGKLFDV
jgi:bifunctional non-homologous end joining protein LigD